MNEYNSNFVTSLTNLAIAKEVDYRNAEANIFIDQIISGLQKEWKTAFSNKDPKIQKIQEIREDIVNLDSDMTLYDPRTELNKLKQYCQQMYLLKDELKTYEHRSELLIKSNNTILEKEQNIHEDLQVAFNRAKDNRKMFLDLQIKSILDLN